MNHEGSNRGATAIEFLVAGTLFLFAVLGIIEMARVLAARTLLIKGAQDAAILAAQYPDMDIDIPENAALPGTPDYSSQQYFRYATARQKVIDEAVSVPTSTLLTSMGQCPPVAIPCSTRKPTLSNQVITTYDLPVPGVSLSFFRADAAIYRPDRWDTTISFQHRDKYGNPTGAASSKYPAEFQLNVSSPTNIQDRLRRYPIVVEMRAAVEPLIWFIPPIELVARGSAFREPSIDSALGNNAGWVPPIISSSSLPTSTPSSYSRYSSTPSSSSAISSSRSASSRNRYSSSARYSSSSTRSSSSSSSRAYSSIDGAGSSVNYSSRGFSSQVSSSRGSSLGDNSSSLSSGSSGHSVSNSPGGGSSLGGSSGGAGVSSKASSSTFSMSSQFSSVASISASFSSAKQSSSSQFSQQSSYSSAYSTPPRSSSSIGQSSASSASTLPCGRVVPPELLDRKKCVFFCDDRGGYVGFTMCVSCRCGLS